MSTELNSSVEFSTGRVLAAGQVVWAISFSDEVPISHTYANLCFSLKPNESDADFPPDSPANVVNYIYVDLKTEADLGYIGHSTLGQH